MFIFLLNINLYIIHICYSEPPQYPHDYLGRETVNIPNNTTANICDRKCV